MNKALSLALATIALSAGLQAQNIKPCGTSEAMQEYFHHHPEAKTAWEQREEILQKEDAEAYKNGYGKTSAAQRDGGAGQTQGTVYYIPVVFHIMHQGGTENITDAQVYDAIKILNRDYRKLNADTSITVSQFKGIAADVEIEFRLATIDPNGACTNGIIRHNSPNTVWQSGTASYYAYTGTTAGKWNPTKYLNVYTVKSISSGAAGYTYLPGTFSGGYAMDAIVILSSYVGSIGTGSTGTSRALTHEVGHWLNLSHTWGGTNQPGVSCSGTDNVSDTPVTDGSTTCNLNKMTCNAGVLENVQNYMDYSYCSTMFTAGQSTRMRNTVINNTGNVGRSNLVGSANLLATGVTNPQICAPIANFKASVRTVCTNAIITFSDSSSNAIVTSFTWSFPGGTLQAGTTINDSMPKVSYAAPGTYAVSYTAATSGGSNAITKNGYITVLSNVASYNTAFTEGFETATLPGSDWSLYGPANNWAVTTSAAATGTQSTKLDNINAGPGDVCILESTSFDISSFSAPKLSFKYAYKQTSSANNDRLQVLTSTDCGQSWQARWTRSGSTLANVTPASTSPFTPSASQFLTYTVNINGVAGSNNVRFRFIFFADYGSTGTVGNNMFMDDINLYDGAAGIASVGELVNLTIFPNPSNGNINLSMTLGESHEVAVLVTDVLGRAIESIPAKSYGSGELSMVIAGQKHYLPGVYFVNVDVDGQRVTRKVLIQ
jgi:PKD repeat protein